MWARVCYTTIWLKCELPYKFWRKSPISIFNSTSVTICETAGKVHFWPCVNQAQLFINMAETRIFPTTSKSSFNKIDETVYRANGKVALWLCVNQGLLCFSRLWLKMQTYLHILLQVSHINFHQYLWNNLWDSRKPPFLAICTPGFITHQYGRNSSISNNFHVESQQSLSNDLWDTRTSPFMLLCTSRFIMINMVENWNWPSTCSKSLPHQI
jgi:hypothetical protein